MRISSLSDALGVDILGKAEVVIQDFIMMDRP